MTVKSYQIANRFGARTVTTVIVAVILGLLSWLAWWTGGPWRPRLQHQEPSAITNLSEAHDHAHGDHVDISASAAKSLGLAVEVVRLQPFTRTLHLPAEVVEKPGQSGLAITAPVQGIIRKIHISPGQAIDNGDLLFTLQVADEGLESAQLSLLDVVTRIAVAEMELDRLNPLAETGAIVGRRKLEMEYQLKQMLSERSARIQELKLRGLSENQVQAIIENRQLVNEIEIHLETSIQTQPAADLATATLRSTTPGSEKSGSLYVVSPAEPAGPIFTIERLDVFSGRLVKKGEQLCHIANHFELLLRGDAFESDVVAIRTAMQNQWSITAEMGLGDSRVEIQDMTVKYLDNHVDSISQTFPFYMVLPNRVVSQRTDNSGRVFQSWQFKPGQRAHVHLPIESFTESIVLPKNAVVQAGPESFAFRLAAGSAFQRRLPPNERLARLERLKSWQLEPVPIHVLYQDRRHVVVASDGQLNLGDLVITDRAYQVYLAWKLQLSGESGGHDHHH